MYVLIVIWVSQFKRPLLHKVYSINLYTIYAIDSQLIYWHKRGHAQLKKSVHSEDAIKAVEAAICDTSSCYCVQSANAWTPTQPEHTQTFISNYILG